MKAAGIIRIIVGLVIAVLLTAILVVLLTGNNIINSMGLNGNWINNLVDRTVYSSGGVNEDTNEIVVSDQARVTADEITKIKIDWVAGSVNIRVGSSNEIVFSESSYTNLTDRQKMRYSVSDSGVLQIRYCDNLDNIFNWFNLDANMPAKTLTMEVPAALMDRLSTLEIGTVSANIDLSGVYGDKTTLSTVSGEIRCTDVASTYLNLSSTSGTLVCENSKADSLEVDNVSGSIRAEGDYRNVNVDSVSGSVRLAFSTAPDQIKVNEVSGSVTVALPADANFTANLDTVSGSISCEFPGTLGNDRVVVGDGSAQYRFDSVSGSLNIVKN